ncbi:hypothetical protein LWI29_008440 [Acer saccharum]|uniref:Uncharacterized protein n=1 Tax=Acer saccharum TaxID=4024 RepID=A0AA39T5L3_ACESA|nr:hypothetical protein LWI29_008440 [Acer saccharum]KAK1586318.1 hypothetical protein Q3G72_001209 [Acer saccharum]
MCNGTAYPSSLQIEEVIVSDEELQNFERVISRFTERKPLEPMSKMESLPPVTAPEADLPVKMYVPDGQPSSSKSNVRNNKKKWGRQKSHTGKWSRRSSGKEIRSQIFCSNGNMYMLCIFHQHTLVISLLPAEICILFECYPLIVSSRASFS